MNEELKEQIMCDVDDEIYSIKKKIEKKYKLDWETARDEVNKCLRVLMISNPEEWVN